MNIQITFRSLIHNKHWLSILMCPMLVTLAAQTNYSYAVPQTFSGSTPTIATKYDSDKDKTTVAAGTMLEEHAIEVGFRRVPMKEYISLVVGYTHKGQRLISPPSVVTMVVESQASQLRFGGQIELLSIIDGGRLALGQMSYSNSKRDPLADLFLLGHVEQVEQLRVEVPLKTFLKLARARTVTLIIGSRKLQLGEQNFNVLSAIADRMLGKTVASTTSSGSVANQPTTKPLSNSTAPLLKIPAETANPTSISKCPIQAPNLLALRGFKLGMSIQEVSNRFQGGMPPLSKPDSAGVCSLEVNFERPKDALGSTGLDYLEFKFLDERIYSIKAIYSVGGEWKERLNEFAYSISQGAGVSGTWIGDPSKEFKLECGAVQLKLHINKPFRSVLSEIAWAKAYLILTDTNAESQLQPRLEKYRQKEQQKEQLNDAEKRKIFRP